MRRLRFQMVCSHCVGRPIGVRHIAKTMPNALPVPQIADTAHILRFQLILVPYLTRFRHNVQIGASAFLAFRTFPLRQPSQ